MNRVELSDKFASMWKKSREDAGKSQHYMAKALGVSRSTIQSWEDGTSCPNQLKGFEWFSVLGLQPLPYYLDLLYPSLEDISISSSEEDIEEALLTCIKGLKASQKRKLLYLLHGQHGSSPSGIIELMTAHLHTPLRDRITIANCVLASYDLADSLGELVKPEHIKPDLDLLRNSLVNSVKAVKRREKAYFVSNKEE